MKKSKLKKSSIRKPEEASPEFWALHQDWFQLGLRFITSPIDKIKKERNKNARI